METMTDSRHKKIQYRPKMQPPRLKLSTSSSECCWRRRQLYQHRWTGLKANGRYWCLDSVCVCMCVCHASVCLRLSLSVCAPHTHNAWLFCLVRDIDWRRLKKTSCWWSRMHQVRVLNWRETTHWHTLCICSLSTDDKDFVTQQPAGIVNGTLRPFQIEGVNWLYQLHRVGANGLLADEMVSKLQ